MSHASVCSQKLSPHLLHLQLEHRHLPNGIVFICPQCAAKVLAGQAYVHALFQEHGSLWIRHVGLPNHKHTKLEAQPHKKYPMTNLSRGRGIVSIHWMGNLTSSHLKHAAHYITRVEPGVTSACGASTASVASPQYLKGMSQTTRSTRSGHASSFQKTAVGMRFKCPYLEFQVCQTNGLFIV